MHDAAEAVIGDIPRPLKILLPDYKKIEKRIEKAICKAFNVTYPFSDETKIADMRLLAAEQIQVMYNEDAWGPVQGFEPAEIVVQFWDPELAFTKFLDRYTALRPVSEGVTQ